MKVEKMKLDVKEKREWRKMKQKEEKERKGT